MNHSDVLDLSVASLKSVKSKLAHIIENISFHPLLHGLFLDHDIIFYF